MEQLGRTWGRTWVPLQAEGGAEQRALSWQNLWQNMGPPPGRMWGRTWGTLLAEHGAEHGSLSKQNMGQNMGHSRQNMEQNKGHSPGTTCGRTWAPLQAKHGAEHGALSWQNTWQNMGHFPGRTCGRTWGPLQAEHGAERRTLSRPGLQHCYCSVQEIRHNLFGRRGIVPDPFAIQIWIELAWLDGFDRAGAKELGYKIVDAAQRIGATEAAALFRFFNVKADVVEFHAGDGIFPHLEFWPCPLCCFGFACIASPTGKMCPLRLPNFEADATSSY
jgi:Peptidase family C78